MNGLRLLGLMASLTATLVSSAALSGGSSTDQETVTAGRMVAFSRFVDGTRELAVIVETFDRREIEGSPRQPWLLEAGYRDEDIVDASEVLATTFCYGHNAGAGCKHQSIL